MYRHAFELYLRIDELIMQLTEITACLFTVTNVYFLIFFLFQSTELHGAEGMGRVSGDTTRAGLQVLCYLQSRTRGIVLPSQQDSRYSATFEAGLLV
jgi:hypothetical protein